jgi:PAS domain S-box-containing protein
MSSDTSTRRNTEQALAVQRERFQLLVEGVKDYAILMLDPDGMIIVSWNAGVERIKGYRAEEAMGRHFSLFYTQEAIDDGHPEMELRVASAEGRFEEEGWRVRKDGTRFWASVLITALVREDGELRGPHGTIWLTVAIDDGRAVISVGDSGRGIAPESIERLFVPFERLGAEQGDIAGTGLGLSLSKRLVELMGGTLTVQSEVGRGSVFHITLESTTEPVCADEPAPVGVTPADMTATVLYIEDNLANLRLVERILAHVGNMEVISAMQGKLGLELARAHRPDLILLDLHLPDMTGEDVAITLRQAQETRDIPIVILTAAAHASQRRRLLDLGVHGYLTKPFKVPQMLGLVEQIIGARTPSPPQAGVSGDER